MTYKSLTEKPASASFLFSICTLVTSKEEYNIMKQSFEDCGFTDRCEYMIADNSSGNKFDAYEAIRRFIAEAQGKYLVIVHQDVRCIDKIGQLENCLDQLSAQDEKWAVAGNAGGIGYHQFAHYINNAGRIIKTTKLPARVSSLDENFLVIKKEASLTVSADIKTFHLYGTDICIIADFLGYTSYVIPFMVKHLSLGNLKDLKKHVGEFVNLYGKKIRSRYMETTCTKFYLSNSGFKNKVYNSSVIFFLVKFWQKIKLGYKRLSAPNPLKRTITNE
ncbi:hypothetical protein [Terrimonas pollutisoli]|uniref:hypothetical protein n=1 Tax=Terrimonas pollutisoli TaxID=3034147 RepID=UPI0023EC2A4C|nr:hypothetical protein [Terrimonas sp. H1YJ31]